MSFAADLIAVFLVPIVFSVLAFVYLFRVPDLQVWAVVLAAVVTTVLIIMGWLTALIVRPFE